MLALGRPLLRFKSLPRIWSQRHILIELKRLCGRIDNASGHVGRLVVSDPSLPSGALPSLQSLTCPAQLVINSVCKSHLALHWVFYELNHVVLLAHCSGSTFYEELAKMAPGMKQG